MGEGSCKACGCALEECECAERARQQRPVITRGMIIHREVALILGAREVWIAAKKARAKARRIGSKKWCDAAAVEVAALTAYLDAIKSAPPEVRAAFRAPSERVM